MEQFECQKRKLRQEYISSYFQDQDTAIYASADSHDTASNVDNANTNFVVSGSSSTNTTELTTLISKMGHGVIECFNGEMVVETVGSSRHPGKRLIDGVILEVEMPFKVGMFILF